MIIEIDSRCAASVRQRSGQSERSWLSQDVYAHPQGGLYPEKININLPRDLTTHGYPAGEYILDLESNSHRGKFDRLELGFSFSLIPMSEWPNYIEAQLAYLRGLQEKLKGQK